MTYRSTVSLPATRGEFINDSLVVLTRPSGSWQGVDTFGRREDALLPLGVGRVEGLDWMMRNHLLSCTDPTPLCRTIGLFSSPPLASFYFPAFPRCSWTKFVMWGHFQACCVQRIDCKRWSICYGGGHLWLEPHGAISACPRPERGSSADHTAWPLFLS